MYTVKHIIMVNKGILVQCMYEDEEEFNLRRLATLPEPSPLCHREQISNTGLSLLRSYQQIL